ncbi:MAG: 23S rRNA (adenine(2030)-N(6))-methyltransferase RlmJ [Burkholderiales bacterium]
MLAYRHAFHAGNHADVLKHLVLSEVLRHLVAKDKPFTLVDTHAGAGGYTLFEGPAQKKLEFEHGIARLWGRNDLPPAVARYAELVRQFHGAEGKAWPRLGYYPGSPQIANMLLRPDDPLHVYELHTTDHRLLEETLGSRPHTRVSKADGFAALKGELPPPSKRGVVLMDPSYEIKTDYAAALSAVREGLRRFAQAVMLVWVPQVQLRESVDLPQRLKSAAHGAPRGWLHARLTVQPPDAKGFGLMGSHMVVINPPFGLHATLAESLPYLVKRLGQYDGAHHLLEQHAV